MLTDTQIDNMLTTVGCGRKFTVDPGGANETDPLPVKFDGETQREDLASGQVIVSRPQVLIRLSAVSGFVVGGRNGTQLRDEETSTLYRAFDVIRDSLYARILLTKV